MYSSKEIAYYKFILSLKRKKLQNLLSVTVIGRDLVSVCNNNPLSYEDYSSFITMCPVSYAHNRSIERSMKNGFHGQRHLGKVINSASLLQTHRGHQRTEDRCHRARRTGLDPASLKLANSAMSVTPGDISLSLDYDTL